MHKAVNHLYEFGPFVLDPGERLLRHGVARMELPPRAFDTLGAGTPLIYADTTTTEAAAPFAVFERCALHGR